MAHFDDFSRLLGDEFIMTSQRRWNSLPHSLRNMEYHTSEILRGALEKTPLYKRAMQTRKIQWIGLKLSPPLLLGLSDGNEQDEQNREWEEA